MEGIEEIINEIIDEADPNMKHDDTVRQIEKVFKRNGFYTTREYYFYVKWDKTYNRKNKRGRIDLVARKGNFKVAVEYDHRASVKYKSFEKIIKIKPNFAIGITGHGYMKPNIDRANKYKTNISLYLISLREKKYELVGGPKEI